MKRVTVLLRSAPTRRLVEALRMSVGQTLAEHRVRLIFLDDAVYILQEAQENEREEIRLPLETLALLGHEMIAESESLEARGVHTTRKGVRRASRAEIAELLLESDLVMTW